MRQGLRKQGLERAKEARKTPSVAERIIWEKLRADKLGFRFRREVPVGRYRLDFYCPEAKLAIELDGDQHLERVLEDKVRDEWLTSQGIRVIRFRNVDFIEAKTQSVTDILDQVRAEYQLRSPRQGH